jgi:hypothetical protein
MSRSLKLSGSMNENSLRFVFANEILDIITRELRAPNNLDIVSFLSWHSTWYE